jgi:hypothetical protein
VLFVIQQGYKNMDAEVRKHARWLAFIAFVFLTYNGGKRLLIDRVEPNLDAFVPFLVAVLCLLLAIRLKAED